jgi:D-alanyl-lipoteichoic acid acyltransferase DltB (MBOAT superfamily)
VVFTTYEFVLFLACVTALYYTAFKRAQWQFLLAASVAFYAYSGWRNLLFIAVTVVTTFIAARCMARLQGKRERRPWLIAALTVNIGILLTLKFTRLAFPLGLSFFTLQTMSYLIDAYRAKDGDAVERNPFKLALFTSFFPQLLQGPMSRYGTLKRELFEPHAFSGANVSAGLERIALGYFKKLVIADRVMPVIGGLSYPVAAAVYAVALYCDFTGGIDVAIGVAKLLGITLTENFDSPYYSRNIQEFWRRWHMTMGAWFRDYVFSPLSTSLPSIRLAAPCKRAFGDRIGRRVPIWLTIMVTWFATGLWHGADAHFIVWGLANGAVIIVSQELTNSSRDFARKFPRLTASKVFDAFRIVRTFCLMSLIRSLDWTIMRESSAALGTSDWLCAGLATLFVVFYSRLRQKRSSPEFNLAFACVMVVLIAVFGAYGQGYSVSQFIYTRF